MKLETEEARPAPEVPDSGDRPFGMLF
jgi:hypothetical protein